MTELFVAQDQILPRIPIGEAFEKFVDWLYDHFLPFFEFLSSLGTSLYDLLTSALLFLPALVMVALLTLLGWWLRGWKFGLYGLISSGLIVSMGFWVHAMQTLALVLIATAIAVTLSLPVGVLAAHHDGLSRLLRPVLDFMQTLPPFVYLVPALALFGIGVFPGMVATVIFATPPGVRLTELGIRQVDPQMVEAGEAFGATRWQILSKIQLQLAMPTILAGINQVIMLALSMVVIAALVGAGGLGEDVYSSITQTDIALGGASGLAVVLLAIYLDRLTQALGDRSAVKKAERLAGAS
ncbi:ABC transporter permease [Mycolicibacterium palauense]|uniref:ABC transporter permease n=1 Tax=Mycolicibacterium palauense TaxID=2034511 RepID=UPI000BFEBF71|nr:proline/glycine betaine ABC transporter permease [Mycolicibacterium palauense]